MACIFCDIALGKIPSAKAYEDENFFAFHDLNPVAPAHILLIPKKHVSSLDELSDAELAAKLLLTAAQIAREAGINETGYRLITNVGSDGGQSIAHLHFHIIGGKKLKWEF